MPVEPPPCAWELPDPRDADDQGIVGVGADLEPGTLLAAYRAGLFPMRLGRRAAIAWWSPDPRGVIPLDGFHASRSLQGRRKHFDVTFDCANDSRPGGDDYRYVATVHREVVDGRADVHSADDVCPRSVDAPYVVDPYPNGKIRDKGCGKPKPDGTKGAPVTTDVLGP